MGVTVRQKVPGRGNPYHVFVHLNGIIRSKAVGEKRDAQAVASALRRKLIMGEFNLDTFATQGAGESPAVTAPQAATATALTFAQAAERWMAEHVTPGLKLSTAEGYEIVLRRHLLPEWATRSLVSIKRSDVKALLLKKQKAGIKIHNLKIVLSSLFSFALEAELIEKHPAQRTGKFLRRVDRKKEIRPLTKTQVGMFLAGAERFYPDSYPLLLCAFRTGMRLGELMGLRWSDVNFNENLLEVRQTYLRGRIDTPKSHKGRRVDMSDQLKMVLLGHRQRMLAKFGTLPEPVFCNTDGSYQHGGNFRNRVFAQLIRRLDMARFRIHDIRHTFASLLLAQGAPIVYVKEALGHASIQTTVDIYGHLAPGANRNEVNRLDDPREAGLRIAN